MVTAKNNICITTLKKKLDPSLSEGLLFLHAISGCDTTSRPFGIGKVTVLKKYIALKSHVATFMNQASSKERIKEAGEKALLEIYGCPSLQSIDAARVEKFQMKVAASSGYVAPEKLPPTSDAASFHSYRTYHQVQTWRGNDLSPVEWGWSATPNGLVPIKMVKSAAPEPLLRTIRCNCSDRCDKRTCTCRKNGLQCTPACGQCKGLTCLNAPCEIADDEENEE